MSKAASDKWPITDNDNADLRHPMFGGVWLSGNIAGRINEVILYTSSRVSDETAGRPFAGISPSHQLSLAIPV